MKKQRMAVMLCKTVPLLQHATEWQRLRGVSAMLAGRPSGGGTRADDVAVPAGPVRRQRRGQAHRHRLPVRVLARGSRIIL